MPFDSHLLSLQAFFQLVVESTELVFRKRIPMLTFEKSAYIRGGKERDQKCGSKSAGHLDFKLMNCFTSITAC